MTGVILKPHIFAYNVKKKSEREKLSPIVHEVNDSSYLKHFLNGRETQKKNGKMEK